MSFKQMPYSDGTIRNKLMIGHLRTQIYVVNFITIILAALAMFVAYMIPVICLGFPLFGLPEMSGAVYFKMLLTSFAMIVASCSIYVMVSMSFSNKAGATVVNLLVCFIVLMGASMIMGALSSPEFYTSYGADGTLEYIPNPSYISGIKRVILQTIVDVLPMGQALQFATGTIVTELWLLSVYSIVVTIVSVVVGIVVFSKKNIK